MEQLENNYRKDYKKNQNEDNQNEDNQNEYELCRLNALYDLGLLNANFEDRFDKIIKLAKIIFDVPIVLFSLIDKNHQLIKSCLGTTEKEINRTYSICNKAIMIQKTLIINDVNLDPIYKNNPLVKNPPYIKSYIGSPIKNNNYCIGTLCLMDSKPRSFTDKEIQILNTLSEQIKSEFKFIKDINSLNKQNIQLHEEFRQKTELMTVINHDLLNMLSPILLMSELMLEDASYSNIEDIKLINESAKHIHRLSNDLMDIFKSDIQKFNIEKKTVKPEEIQTSIEEIIRSLRVKVIFNFYLRKKVNCDLQRIKQVFTNLTKNAESFLDKNGIIWIKIIQESNNIKCIVQDNGIGIPKSKIPQLFKRFTKNINATFNRNHKSSGLGLSICKDIVESHGGKIWYDDSYQEGARFIFTIPYV